MSEQFEPSEGQPEPSKLTPEEKLLHAIFGKVPLKKPEDRPQLTENERTAKKAALRDKKATSLRGKIEQVLKMLTEREREIIKLRYGLSDGNTYTLEEIGKVFSTTRERIRQIEAEAMRKLQRPSPMGDAPESK